MKIKALPIHKKGTKCTQYIHAGKIFIHVFKYML